MLVISLSLSLPTRHLSSFVHRPPVLSISPPFFLCSLQQHQHLHPLSSCAPQPLRTPGTAGFRGFGHGVEVPLGPRTGDWRCRSGRRAGTRKDLRGQDHRPPAVQAQREVQHAEVRPACYARLAHDNIPLLLRSQTPFLSVFFFLSSSIALQQRSCRHQTTRFSKSSRWYVTFPK